MTPSRGYCPHPADPGRDLCGFHYNQSLDIQKQRKDKSNLRKKRETRLESNRKQVVRTRAKAMANLSPVERKLQVQQEALLSEAARVLDGSSGSLRNVVRKLYPGFHPALKMIDMIENPQPVTGKDGEVHLEHMSPLIRAGLLKTLMPYFSRTMAPEKPQTSEGVKVVYEIDLGPDAKVTTVPEEDVPPMEEEP